MSTKPIPSDDDMIEVGSLLMSLAARPLADDPHRTHIEIDVRTLREYYAEQLACDARVIKAAVLDVAELENQYNKVDYAIRIKTSGRERRVILHRDLEDWRQMCGELEVDEEADEIREALTERGLDIDSELPAALLYARKRKVHDPDAPRRCIGCEQVKPTDQFNRCAGRFSYRFRPRCKDCSKMQSAEWNKAHPDRDRGYRYKSDDESGPPGMSFGPVF